MPDNLNKLSLFWQELKRRKVIYFLIAYVATCFAIIEFIQITSDNFTIPENTFNLLYILAGIGIPLVIILPWLINRRKPETASGESNIQETGPREEVQTPGHNLPAQLTTFIGREKEMLTVQDLISEHRLLTLTGAGGCGKTRLAIELAGRIVSEYKDGVWLVDLAPIASEGLLAKEITEVLSIAEVPNQAIIDTLIEKIKEQELLITPECLISGTSGSTVISKELKKR